MDKKIIMGNWMACQILRTKEYLGKDIYHCHQHVKSPQFPRPEVHEAILPVRP